MPGIEIYEAIVDFYIDIGLIGGLFLAFIENIFPPLPIVLIIGGNVAAYGLFLGFLISYVGHVLGAILVFYFVRKVIKPRLDNKIKKPNSKLVKFENWVGHRSFHLVLIILSLPFAPYSIVNFAAGISNIGAEKYVVAIVIGNMFMVGFLSIVSMNFENAVTSGEVTSLVYAALLIILGYIVGKIIEKKFDLK